MEKILKDIRYLTETLEHRQSATDQEEQAADYVLGRLKPYVDYAHKTSFAVVDNFRLVMAAYYGEFVITCLLAFWWPTVAFFYGACIFLAYVAEYIGYPVFSRLLAFYESSSVAGFKEGEDPDRLLVFTAYLDTDSNPVSDSASLPVIRHVHRALMVGMVLILATCLVDAFGVRWGATNPLTMYIRIGGMIFFGIIAAAVLLVSLGAIPSPGANFNASGVAALLQVAERLHERGLRKPSVLFYFSGGHFANMAGMRALISEITALRKEAFIINIEGVGAGQLCYTRAEGIMLRTPCSKALVSAAQYNADRYKAREARVHDFATNAYLPLLRGLNAITLIGLDEHDLPVNYTFEEDAEHEVNPQSVMRAALFAESVGRTVMNEADLPGTPPV